jgi:uncharacterized membrane protein
MNKQTLKPLAVSAALLGLLLSASLSGAQVAALSRLPGRRAGSSATQAANNTTKTQTAASYTLLSIPGTVGTFFSGINLGVTNPKLEIAGGGSEVGGAVVQVSGEKTVTEIYKPVNFPHIPGQDQSATAINDVGQIVGDYVDSSGMFHGYEFSDGKFTTLNVPDSIYTFPGGINNSGEVVGQWRDTNAITHGFTLIGGAYTSVDYPGAGYTVVNAVNSNGDIVGSYGIGGVVHGFLLSSGTYTSFDPPGSISTGALGINDAGDIVGEYCTTSACANTDQGTQAFLLSGGVFTTITVLGETSTYAFAINNNGVILGQYQDATGFVLSFLQTP